MSTVEKNIEVNVPVSVAYNQWTQFEQFPRFMEGIKEVRQLSDKRLFWCAEVAGKDKEWDAEITEQVPDKIIAWRSTSGAQNDGVISFEAIDANRCRIHVKMDYDPEGIVENVGDALGVFSLRVTTDLAKFQEFIESRGSETGAWRGEIHNGQVQSDSGMGSVTAGTTGAYNNSGSTGTLGSGSSGSSLTGSSSLNGTTSPGSTVNGTRSPLSDVDSTDRYGSGSSSGTGGIGSL